LEGRGARKSAAIAEKFGARVEKPDAKPDAKQALRPVLQKAKPVSSTDSGMFGASWQEYERALEAKWGGPLVPAVPDWAAWGSSRATGDGERAGEPE
jgi:hypothetical protein